MTVFFKDRTRDQDVVLHLLRLRALNLGLFIDTLVLDSLVSFSDHLAFLHRLVLTATALATPRFLLRMGVHINNNYLTCYLLRK